MVWNRGWTVHAILTGIKNGSDQTGGRIGIILQLLLLQGDEVGLIKVVELHHKYFLDFVMNTFILRYIVL